jgi:Kef-type K+ transport system membrane component KefB
MMRRRAFVYTTGVVLSIGAILAVLQLGDVWFPAPGTAPAGEAPGAAHAAHSRGPLAVLLVQLLVIILSTHSAGNLARLIRQPAVIGEIAAGLLLGPSLLGHVWPEGYALLFPAASLNVLRLMSQVGVILFMFSVGLELNVHHLRHRAPTAIVVSHFSIVVPFLLGVLLALVLFESSAPPGVSFHAFALFMGIALSITAFPVLARVLEERGMTRTPLGATAIACAAVDDVTAWCLLAVVVTLVTAGGTGGTLGTMALAIGVFAGVMVFVVRPLLPVLLRDGGSPLSRTRMALTLIVMLASALATEAIGIHALFGAFLAGVIMPQSPELRQQLRDRLEALSSVFLLPIFFAFTGLRTEIGLLGDAWSLVVCLGIVLTAIAGKLVGSMLAARWTGATWHDAFVLGTLMNTRGLMELIALNVGYDLGILSPRMFTMLVVMALVTTAMTGPLLDLARHKGGDVSPVPGRL